MVHQSCRVRLPWANIKSLQIFPPIYEPNLPPNVFQENYIEQSEDANIKLVYIYLQIRLQVTNLYQLKKSKSNGKSITTLVLKVIQEKQ